jgi:hypothetical protein
MQEWSPFKSVTPLHLKTALVSRRGEFRLVALPGERTRLEGTTWYSLDIAPQAYFRLWSGAIIGSIHERVLSHIRQSAS